MLLFITHRSIILAEFSNFSSVQLPDRNACAPTLLSDLPDSSSWRDTDHSDNFAHCPTSIHSGRSVSRIK